MLPLPKGTPAPKFYLKVTPDQKISLMDFSGQPVVLVFYPADFSPVCKTEVVLFNSMLSEFEKYKAQVLGISVDNVWSHMAFASQYDVRYPLLADFHPKGEVAKLYQCYREEEGQAERALYVIDPKGKIAWGHISPIGVSPGIGPVLEALEMLK